MANHDRRLVSPRTGRHHRVASIESRSSDSKIGWWVAAITGGQLISKPRQLPTLDLPLWLRLLRFHWLRLDCWRLRPLRFNWLRLGCLRFGLWPDWLWLSCVRLGGLPLRYCVILGSQGLLT